MSQGSLVLPTVGVISGLTMMNDINAALDALNTNNSGSSAPTNGAGGVAEEGQLWLDTTVSATPTLKQYDGGQWVILGVMDTVNHAWSPPIGGGAAFTLASAGTTDLGSVASPYKSVTGTATITSLGTTAKIGTIHVVTFTGAALLTYNGASLILPTAANITTTAGDVAWFVQISSGNWKCLSYTLASGAPLSTAAVGSAQLIASALGTNTPTNLRINATVGSNALTVNLVGVNNAAPSVTNPIWTVWRDSTIANGDPLAVSLQAALSVTIAAGNTCGAQSGNVPFRLWVCEYYNGGTPAVGVFNASISTQIFPLAEGNLVTTAASTNGGSSAGTHYANVSTITNTPFRILGYMDWETGLATAGTWASAPTRVTLFGPGIKKPGEEVQRVIALQASTFAISNNTYTVTNLSGAITLSSPANAVAASASGSVGIASTSVVGARLCRTSVSNLFGSELTAGASAAGNSYHWPVALEGLDYPGVTSAVTYLLAAKGSVGGSGFDANTFIQLREIMG